MAERASLDQHTADIARHLADDPARTWTAAALVSEHTGLAHPASVDSIPTRANPEDHVILPETISKEPLGPMVRQGDSQWRDVVMWTVFAMVAAEVRKKRLRLISVSLIPSPQRLLKIGR